MRKYGEKLGLHAYFESQDQAQRNAMSSQNQGQPNFGGQGSREKLNIYYFNIDLMYVIKARLFILEKQLQQKLDSKCQSNFYVCPKSKVQKCMFRGEVDELDFEEGKKKCQLCQSDLVAN
jgi:hypothetical protein